MPLTNEKFETDPRFPSGAWRGYWLQHGMKGWMKLMLEFRTGCVSGDGVDVVGQFTVRGSYCLKTGQVTIRKHYAGRYMVAYDGAAASDVHLRGQWNIRACLERGPWHIWPLPAGQSDSKFVETAADQRVHITSWADGEKRVRGKF